MPPIPDSTTSSATPTAVPTHLMFDAAVEENLSKIEEIRSHYRPGDGLELRRLFEQSIQEIQHNANANLKILDEAGRYEARVASGKAYQKAEDSASAYLQDFAISPEYFLKSSNFNPRLFLADYADAFYQSRLGCPNAEMISSDQFQSALQANPSNDPNALDQGCARLDESDQSITHLMSIAFAEREPSPNYVYGAWHFSPNEVRRLGETYPLKTGYSFFGAEIGFLRAVGHSENSGGSGPLVEGAFRYVSGGEDNLGSHSYQFGLRGGWEQHITRFFFLNPRAGVGLAQNWLNFGEGLPLERETSWMGGFYATAGVEFPLDPFLALRISGGYFYEQTLLGSPAYYNHGPLAAIALKTNRFLEGRQK